MKLLLSDATAIALTSYEKTSATVNGNTVDAILFMVEKTTLEKVKKLFSDADNMDVIHVYTDDNLLLETFSGYQIRKSILLGDTDTSFGVILAKTSEVSEQMTALQATVNELSSTVKDLVTNIATFNSTVTDIKASVSDEREKYKKHDELIQNITDLLNEVKSAAGDRDTSVSNLEIDFEKIHSKFEEFANNAQLISQQYTDSIAATNNTNATVTEALRVVDSARNEMSTKVDEIEQILQLLEEVKKVATDNDEKVIKYGDVADVLTNSVNTAKLQVEEFEKTVSQLGKNVKDVSENITKANQSIQTVSNTVNGISEDVTALSEKTEQNDTAAEELASRITKLEPITDYTSLSLEDAKKYRINESKVALAEYLETHPITSTCHGGTAGQYSITSEKQSFLQAMITMTTMAESSGIEYQPSWNKVGESCTYDWTLAELQQLAIEIEAQVRPLVSHQQSLEREITQAKTMLDLQGVNISYENIKANDIVLKQAETETLD